MIKFSLSQRGEIMAPGARSRIVTWTVPALSLTTAAVAFGAAGTAAAGLLAILWLVWRYDNSTGSFLLLAVLFLIALAVPVLLLALMAVTR
jgi:hypothetical protein